MAVTGSAIVGWVATNATAISAVAAVGGVAATAYGQIEQGEQAKAAADYNARVQENAAAYDLDAANARAAKIRKAGAIQQAEASASLAGSGVKLGEGSAVDINRTIGQQSELDAVNTMLTGKRNSESSMDQAGLLRSQGSNAEWSGYIGAGSTILGAASKGQTLAAGWKSTRN